VLRLTDSTDVASTLHARHGVITDGAGQTPDAFFTSQHCVLTSSAVQTPDTCSVVLITEHSVLRRLPFTALSDHQQYSADTLHINST
jgi:hypothetical protein